MTREERRRILGDEVIAKLHARVELAPDPSPELVEKLRRLWMSPADTAPAPRPANNTVKPKARTEHGSPRTCDGSRF
ncbi:hypothetical protein [Streptomyces sp. NBC_00996]|uniref:hypothetical protein n=1 Tax=Streptomyces sp. NBC_00996 TaxID=2903710 RepID=UPI003869E6C9|nr:hypothetical protein OG390_15430 [Streptomyces sp. NBC_00996]